MGLTSAYPSSWWGSLEHPPWGVSLHTGASTCSTYWPDLKSSVSPNQHEFVAGILNMSDPAHEAQVAQLRRWSCTKALTEPHSNAKHCLLRLLSPIFLSSLYLSQHEKQLCPCFPHQRI